MKELFANVDAGLVGLLFFFAVFAGIAMWALWPSNRDQLESHKFIPLSGDDA